MYPIILEPRLQDGWFCRQLITLAHRVDDRQVHPAFWF